MIDFFFHGRLKKNAIYRNIDTKDYLLKAVVITRHTAQLGYAANKNKEINE